MYTLQAVKSSESLKQKFKQEFKLITKQFIKNYNKNDLWLLFEVCEYDFEVTQKLLKNQSKAQVTKLLNDIKVNPKVGYQVLYKLVEKFQLENEKEAQILLQTQNQQLDKELQLQNQGGNEQEELKQDNAQHIIQQEQMIITGPSIFDKLHHYLILTLLDYLDPISLSRFSQTCKYNNELATKPELYKKLCITLYKQIPTLPLVSVFEPLKQYIITRPQEFSQTVILQAQQNIRKLIWQKGQDKFITPAKFYKQFGSWYNMFLNAPRINYSGVYSMKEQYIKIGEKDMTHQYSPIIHVSYYRYLRFLSDGRVMSNTSVKKLNSQKIINTLSIKVLENIHNHEPIVQQQYFLEEQKINENQVILGEFMQKEDRIFIKLVKGSTIFSYNLRIKSSIIGKHNLLILDQYDMQVIDLNHTYQLQQPQDDNNKMFTYQHFEEFRNEIEDKNISRCTF